ncbi:MAG TPA: TFIIB-type zinc ribbon-containing protein [Nitrososphaeraceae archaeon]|nr:TFIIB-type zinc ribbon-containing protein [Nitrososphaeraceae archaeon]
MIMEQEIKDKKTIAVTTCSTCNKDNMAVTDPEYGEIVCSNCGTVISEKLEDTSHQERRASTLEEADRRARTGTPFSLALHDMGLSTIIGRENKDASGQIIDIAMRSKIERLRTWDHRTLFHKSGDRNFMKAFGQLDRLKEKLGLSDTIVEKAAYTYRKVQERGLVKGRTIDSMLAASLYSACREMETPRTIKDIAEKSNVNRKDIARSYRTLVFELGIRTPVVSPMKCIARVANKLGIKEKTKQQALSIMEEVVIKEISAGKEPMGLAATVLYASSLRNEEKIPQKEIAAASGVTEVTIRNRFKDLKRFLEGK